MPRRCRSPTAPTSSVCCTASLRALIEREKPDYIVRRSKLSLPTPGRTGTGRAESGPPPGAGGKAHHEPRRHSPPGGRRAAASTSCYRFADSEEGFRAAVTGIGLPCIVKPVMSSSGKGQSFIRSADQLSEAWRYAQQGGRAGAGRVIVEGGELRFRNHPAHRQRCRWRAFLRSGWSSSGRRRLPRVLAATADERPGPSGGIAQTASPARWCLALGGYGLFGVELFVCGDRYDLQRSLPDHTTPGW